MNEFLQANASALFALAGAFGGSIISFGAAWVLRKRDYDLRLWGKLQERRIVAHEKLIQVALEMRVMVGLGGVDETGEVNRTPQVLMSREAFEAWFREAVGSCLGASTWLSTPAKREANFLQDYLVTLHMHMEGVPSERLRLVGTIVREDFVGLSASIERLAFDFFNRDVRRLNLTDPGELHKYPRTYTEQRLKETKLLTRWEEIRRLASDQRVGDIGQAGA